MNTFLERLSSTSSVLILSAACAANSTAVRPEEASLSVEAVITAMEAVPLDSICAGICPVLIVDTAVRGTPKLPLYRVFDAPIALYLSRPQLLPLQRRAGKLMAGSVKELTPATGVVALAAVLVASDDASRAQEVGVIVQAPGSWGGIFAVKLERSLDAWVVRGTELHEP